MSAKSLLLLLLLSCFSCVWLCATPYTAAHQAPPSLEFSSQEHWSGLPFPSLVHESERWKWSHSVVSDSSWPHGLQPTRLLHPWDFPGKSTGVGCHCLLHKSLQSCPIICDLMDCSPLGSSVHGILQIRILEWVAMPSSRGSSWSMDWIMFLMSPALVRRFFTISATWEALDVPEDSQTQHIENQSQHPCLQINFPFSVNNATSTWSPKRETGRHSEHPSSVPTEHRVLMILLL